MCADCAASERGVCFKHKLRTLNWGHVPGGNRQQSGHDKDAFRNQFGNPDTIRDYTEESTEGIGHLRWHGNDAYKKDKVTGDYEKLTAHDYDRLMYGTKGNADDLAL